MSSRKTFNENRLTILLLVTSCLLCWATLPLGQYDLVKLMNKFVFTALFWTLSLLFITFYQTRAFHVHQAVITDPRSTTTLLAAFIIGSAIILAVC